MKKFILVFCVASSILMSCVTASVVSNRSPEIEEKIERLYVTMNGAPKSKMFFNSFSRELANEMELRNVDAEFQVFNELSLETEDDLLNKVIKFGPNYVMTIHQTERRTTVALITHPGATFDIKLIDPTTDKIVWRGSLKTDTVSELSEGAKISAKKLIQKLTMDGILSNPTPGFSN